MVGRLSRDRDERAIVEGELSCIRDMMSRAKLL
jgi:hypothetical protein